VKPFDCVFDFLPCRNWNALPLLILAGSFAAGAVAADFKTINGEEYKDATIKRVEADGVVLATQWGISKVYFSELPPDMQKRFGSEATRTLVGPPAMRTEPLPAAEPQPTAAPQRNPQPIASSGHEIAPEHTYEITRDYVMGGDTGEVAVRLKRGEHYRGRILPNGAELNISGTWCKVASDILSSPKDKN
jgi:hypothetical protein